MSGTDRSITVLDTVFTEYNLQQKFNPSELPGPAHSKYLLLVQDRQSERFAVTKTACISRTLDHLRYGESSYSSAFKRLYPDRQERIAQTRLWLAPVYAKVTATLTREAVELSLALQDRLIDVKRQAALQRKHG